MEYFYPVLYGFIEGLTEFLPVSSTAHLLLLSKALSIPQTDFIKTFEISIQFGAILAVVTLYYRSFFNIDTLKKVVAGFIPTAILGFILYKSIKSLLGSIYVVLFALLIGGIIIIFFENWYKKKLVLNDNDKSKSMSIKQCLIIGCFQSLAFIPGVSRSASTIIGGLSLGLKRETITMYSFLLAVPTMTAATLYDVYKNHNSISISGGWSYLAIGFVVSYIFAIIFIKWFLSFVKKHDFTIFGFYRIFISIIGLFLL